MSKTPSTADAAGGKGDRWQNWSEQDWNNALFRHFFFSNDPQPSPVTRLVVTAEELADVASEHRRNAAAVKSAFVSTVTCSPSAFRRRLSAAQLVKGQWPESNVPPFLIWLIVTCFVASTIERVAFDEGDFRQRLRIILGHPEGTSYGLSDLPLLWQAFAVWLEKFRKQGASYRGLSLPDPGRMNRIGYSIRLSFPVRHDRVRLIRLFTENDVGVEPPVRCVLDLIGARIGRFTPRFQETYEKARHAFRSHRNASDLEMLWSAIREAAIAAASRPPVTSARVRYQLFLETNELFGAEPVLLASRAPTGSARPVGFQKSDVAFRDFPYVVAAGPAGDGVGAVTALLNGTLGRLLPDFDHSPVRTAVSQGVLLFTQGDDGQWALVTTRPNESSVWAIVRQDLVRSVLSIFGRSSEPNATSLKYDGWKEIPPFDAALLARLDHHNIPSLDGVRCLQATSVGTLVFLSGGVPLGGAYLGLSDWLPCVRVSGANGVSLYSVTASAGHQDGMQLIPSESGQEAFQFPADIEDLDGSFRIVGTRGEHVIASRLVVFRAQQFSHDFAQPTEASDWLVEGAASDVVPFTEVERQQWGVAADTTKPRRRSRGRTFSEAVRPRPAESVLADSDRRLDRFIEATAAIATTRRGIPEGELLSLARKAFGLEQDGLSVWDTLRAWLEAGYFDVLTRRRWRGRVYFARTPALVVSRRQTGSVVTLFGLAPRALRKEVDTVAQSLGFRTSPTSSFNSNVPSPPVWLAPSDTQCQAFSAMTRLELRYAKSVETFQTTVREVGDQPRQLLEHYEVRQTWEWSEHGRGPANASGTGPVRLRWLTRPNRPEYFTVERESGASWGSHSRTWAFLVAHVWSGRPAFRCVGPATLIRSADGGSYLPLPIARAAMLEAGVTAGPCTLPSGHRSYAYGFSTESARNAVERLLGGAPKPAELWRRCRWLLEVVDGRKQSMPSDTVLLPAAVVRRLADLHDVPGARDLGRRRVPRFLVPHVRRFLELAGRR